MRTHTIILGCAVLFVIMAFFGVAKHGATLDGERARNMSNGANYPYTDKEPGCSCGVCR